MCVSHRVMSDSWRPHGLQLARLLCLWDSPGKNTGVGCHDLLQGIFMTHGSNPVSFISPALASEFSFFNLFGCNFVEACEPLVEACGIQFPDQKSNPGPLHWEHGVLAPGPPGKSQQVSSLTLAPPGKPEELLSNFMRISREFPGGPVAQSVFPVQGAGFHLRSGNQIPHAARVCMLQLKNPHGTTKTQCSQINKNV